MDGGAQRGSGDGWREHRENQEGWRGHRDMGSTKERNSRSTRRTREKDGESVGTQGGSGEGWRSTDRIRRRREGAQGGSGLASHNPSESFQPSLGVGLCDRDSRDWVSREAGGEMAPMPSKPIFL